MSSLVVCGFIWYLFRMMWYWLLSFDSWPWEKLQFVVTAKGYKPPPPNNNPSWVSHGQNNMTKFITKNPSFGDRANVHCQFVLLFLGQSNYFNCHLNINKYPHGNIKLSTSTKNGIYSIFFILPSLFYGIPNWFLHSKLVSTLALS